MKQWTIIIFFTLFFLLLTGQVFAGTPVAYGWRDHSFSSSTAITNPTGEKPQSKVWYNDGIWWGALYQPSSSAFTIHQFDASSNTWTNTNIILDPRESARIDALWDGSKLYILSHGNDPQESSESAQVRRFTYNSGTQSYSLDSGFPVTVSTPDEGGMEAAVIAKDSTGTLWVTYTQNGGDVYVVRSNGSDTSWIPPYILPFSDEANGYNDDISSIIAFGGNKIGVMWSNQGDDAFYFAVHNDGASDSAWTLEPALEGPDIADDHINLKTDSSGVVYAAIKTSNGNSSDSLTRLLVRQTNGTWSDYNFGRVSESHTRPIVVLDENSRTVYMFATLPTGSTTQGEIYYKQTSMDSISFPEGIGTPFISSSSEPYINNVSSSKQNIPAFLGILLVASDNGRDYYFHNSITGGAPPPNTAPTADEQSVAVDEDTFVDITLTGSDPEGDSLDFTVLSEPTNGVLSGTAPNLTYTPDADFNGTDSFTFHVCDAEPLCDTATISITVNPVNDAPVLASIGNQSVDEGATLDVNLSASDVDGDALSFSLNLDAPSFISLTDNNNGTALLSIAPSLADAGDYDITITVSDGNGGSDAATVTVTVNPVEDADYDALVSLYNSTDGDNWNINTNWLVDPDVCTWYGITCDVSGNVTKINLDLNNLAGTIPPEIGNLTDLTDLSLESGGLTGNIPTEIGNLSNLVNLSLFGNALNGSIPTSIVNLTNLQLLNLSFNELTGSIPTDLGTMPNLVVLDFWWNQLTGSIPVELGQIDSLEVISLSSNQLDGSIPSELGNLPNLIALYLDGNELTGSIPAQVASSASLIQFSAADNELTGSIPNEFGSAPNLTGIDFSYNNLTGTIPPAIGNSNTLQYLGFSFNQLDGTIPNELSSLDLTDLLLADNQLTGTIPVWLGSKTNLEYLYLAGNQFTGSIPSELGNLVNLIEISLARNALTGEIPASLTNLVNLYPEPINDEIDFGFNALYTSDTDLIAFLDANDPGWSDSQTIAPSNIQVTASTETSITLTWDAIPYTTDGGYYEVLYSETSGEPYEISGCTTVDKTETSCEITGLTANTDYFMVVRTFTPAHDTQQNDVFSDLSAEVVASTSATDDYNALVALYNSTDGDNWIVNTNWLTDPNVCTWYGIICNVDGDVTEVVLGNNNLVGTIPSDLGSLSNLTFLDLSINFLNGSIPSEFGNLSNLQYLNFYANNLSGNIPVSMGNMSSLQFLYLSQNELDGEIPPELGNLSNLQVFEVNFNDLTGSIPVALTNLINATYFSLVDNQLTGTIPSAFGTMTNLEVLELGYNQLDGTIPPELGNLSNLYFLYLPGNNLTGTIPPELANLMLLQELHLSYNQLDGAIPPELGSLSNLTHLYLNDNQLDDTIPPEFGNLSALIELRLDQNKLEGIIPSTLGSLANLSGIDLAYNALVGEIPATFTNLTNLYVNSLTDFSFNALYTSDADVLAFINSKDTNWESSQTISPANLQVTASTSTSITLGWDAIPYTADGGYYEVLYSETSGAPYTSGCTTADKTATTCEITGLNANTDYFIVVRTFTPAHGLYQQNDLFSDLSAEVVASTSATDDYNALVALYNSTDGDNWFNNTNWLIEPDVCTWYGITCNVSGNVTEIDLYANNLVGALPSEIGDFPYMEVLDLARNELSGFIPVEIGLLSSLRILDLNWNQLTGNIPLAVAQIQTLEEVHLYTNQLDGTIPNDFTTLPNLDLLLLENNQLSGSIPSGFGQTPSLGALGLSNNQLTGTIPAELGNSSTLRYLGFDNNLLSGTIPNNLANLDLISLTLSGNELTGTLPVWLGDLTNLDELLLGRNRFTGAIPSELGNLINLTQLDLSGNALVGEIPQSIVNLTNLNPSSSESTDLGFNALYSNNGTLVAFLDGKDADWASSQTVAPSNIQVTASTETSITLTWNVIPYTADGGYYEVLYSETSGAPYETSGCTTADKTVTTCDITGLNANTDYFMVVRTFTPAHDTQQNDVFSEVSNEILASTNMVNTAPTADDQSVEVDEDSFVDITLTGSDPEGDSLDFTVLTNPSNGVLSGTAPDLTYTPNADFNSTDSFTFEVCDTELLCDTATISITVNPVNDNPVLASIGNQSVYEGSTLDVNLSASDVDGNTLSFSVNLDAPSFISLTDNSDGTAILSIAPGFSDAGNYDITVTVSDGELDDSETFTVTVGNVNTAPTADDQSVEVDEDSFVDITLTGSDPEGDSLIFTVLTDPSHGVLSGTAPNLTYTPDADFNGSDSFTFEVCDAEPLCDTATISITVNPIQAPSQPIISAPSGTINDTTPDLIWTDTLDATQYRIWVRTNVSPITVVYDGTVDATSVCSAGTCQVTLPTLADTEYRAFVAGYNSVGWGLWSTGSTFTVTSYVSAPSQPIISAPSGTINDTTPDLIWTDTLDATQYRIWVRTNVSPITVVYDGTVDATSVCSAGTCQVTLPTLADTEYRAFVAGYNSVGWGLWSTGSTFTVTSYVSAPSQPIISAPSGTINDTTPDLIWTDTLDATQYRIWVRTNVSPITVVYDGTVDATSVCSAGTCQVTLPTLAETEYRAFVAGYNSVGWGLWSTGSTFTVTSYVSAPSQPIISAPSGTINDTTPDLIWTDTLDATQYRIWVRTNVSPITVVYDGTVDATSVCSAGTCQVTLPTLAETEYRAFVAGYNSVGWGSWSTGTTFTVSTPLALTNLSEVSTPQIQAGSSYLTRNEGSSIFNTIQVFNMGEDVIVTSNVGTITSQPGGWLWQGEASDNTALTTVTITATDDLGTTITDTFDYEVLNINPTAIFRNVFDDPVFQGTNTVFVFSDPTDVSSVDTTAGFNYAVICDAQTSDSQIGVETNYTCTYDVAGIYTVMGMIRDKDGGISNYSLIVEVITPVQATQYIKSVIQDLNTNDGLSLDASNQLSQMMDNVQASLVGGNTQNSLNQVSAFIEQVNSYVALGTLSQAQGDLLIGHGQRLISSIIAS